MTKWRMYDDNGQPLTSVEAFGDWFRRFNEDLESNSPMNARKEENEKKASAESEAIINNLKALQEWDLQNSVNLMQFQQAFNAQEAQKARDYQANLSNTAYQRQARDLKLAGYNPALLLGTSGATSPSSYVATGSVTGGTNLSASYMSMINTQVSAQAQIMSSLINMIGRVISSTNSALSYANFASNKGSVTKKVKPSPSWYNSSSSSSHSGPMTNYDNSDIVNWFKTH